jgi:hypothetical protein
MTRTNCAQGSRLLLFFAEFDLACTSIAVIAGGLASTGPELALPSAVGSAPTNRAIALRPIAFAGWTITLWAVTITRWTIRIARPTRARATVTAGRVVSTSGPLRAAIR